MGLVVLAGCQDAQTLGPLAHEAPTTRPTATTSVSTPTSEPKVENQPAAATPAKPQIFGGSGTVVRAPAAHGGTAESAAGDITLNFVDADVKEVVSRVLGEVLHLNYTIDPKVQAMVTIQTSRPVKREDVLPTLQTALAASGLALVHTSSGVYRLTPIADASRSGAAIVVGQGQAAAGRAYDVQILPLKFVSASEMQRVLQPFLPKGAVMEADSARNLLILSGSGVDLSTVTDMVKSFDIDWVAGMSFAIYPLQAASPQSVVDQLGQIFGPNGSVPLSDVLKFAPLDRMNAVLVVSPQRAYLEQAHQWIERLDKGEDESRPQIYEYHVQNSRAADLAKVLTNLFSNGQVSTVGPQTAPGTTATQIGSLGSDAKTSPTSALTAQGIGSATPGTSGSNGLHALSNDAAGNQAGSTSATSDVAEPDSSSSAGSNGLEMPPVRIVADEKNNTLVIYAKPRVYRMVEKALQKIDVVPLQVLIEATIAEVRLGNNLQYGLQYYFNSNRNKYIFGSSTTPITGPSIPGVFPGFNFVLQHTNTNVVLNLLSSITNVHVVSAPELLVLDHQTASLLVGDQVPIPTAQIQSTVTTGAPLVSTIQYVDTGVILKVTPRVNANGLITLDVSQEVSSVANTSQTVATNSLGPTITQRRIQSTVTVQNGETIALGGLIQDNTSLGKTGVPGLADIPVFGSLFRSTDRSVKRTELLVLLSPRILHDTSEARAATEELRSRLHALQVSDSKLP